MGEIEQYGVWAGMPSSYTAQTEQEDPKSPHITLKFSDSSSSEKEAAINVKSTDTDTRLVYWHNENFQHPLTQTLTSLDQSFHLATSDSSGALSLDYIRTTPQLLTISDGQVLSADVSSGDNDVEKDLTAILDNAISKKATIYIFGSSYDTGFHDIHMNQGSLPKYDNGVGQDGAMIFSFPDDNHFEAVFLAFASQQIPTDDQTGEPASDSKTLADIIGGNTTTSSS